MPFALLWPQLLSRWVSQVWYRERPGRGRRFLHPSAKGLASSGRHSSRRDWRWFNWSVDRVVGMGKGPTMAGRAGGGWQQRGAFLTWPWWNRSRQWGGARQRLSYRKGPLSRAQAITEWCGLSRSGASKERTRRVNTCLSFSPFLISWQGLLLGEPIRS